MKKAKLLMAMMLISCLASCSDGSNLNSMDSQDKGSAFESSSNLLENTDSNSVLSASDSSISSVSVSNSGTGETSEASSQSDSQTSIGTETGNKGVTQQQWEALMTPLTEVNFTQTTKETQYDAQGNEGESRVSQNIIASSDLFYGNGGEYFEHKAVDDADIFNHYWERELEEGTFYLETIDADTYAFYYENLVPGLFEGLNGLITQFKLDYELIDGFTKDGNIYTYVIEDEMQFDADDIRLVPFTIKTDNNERLLEIGFKTTFTIVGAGSLVTEFTFNDFGTSEVNLPDSNQCINPNDEPIAKALKNIENINNLTYSLELFKNDAKVNEITRYFQDEEHFASDTITFPEETTASCVFAKENEAYNRYLKGVNGNNKWEKSSIDNKEFSNAATSYLNQGLDFLLSLRDLDLNQFTLDEGVYKTTAYTEYGELNYSITLDGDTLVSVDFEGNNVHNLNGFVEDDTFSKVVAHIGEFGTTEVTIPEVVPTEPILLAIYNLNLQNATLSQKTKKSNGGIVSSVTTKFQSFEGFQNTVSYGSMTNDDYWYQSNDVYYHYQKQPAGYYRYFAEEAEFIEARDQAFDIFSQMQNMLKELITTMDVLETVSENQYTYTNSFEINEADSQGTVKLDIKLYLNQSRLTRFNVEIDLSEVSGPSASMGITTVTMEFSQIGTTEVWLPATVN